MKVGKESYFANFLLVVLIFYLFVFIIAIFGYVLLFFIKKINGKDWELNFLEYSIISYAIGISIYLSYCFILDIFMFYNFFSGYYLIVMIDALFIFYLIYRGDLNRDKISNFFLSLKSRFTTNRRQSIILILILIFTFSWQIWVQWEIVTKEYAIPSKDTYVWLGQSWYLLEKGYLWREHMPLHYPKGYTFLLAGPELIYPDWRLAYFYIKFGGIPFFSFYILTIFIILKRLLEKNYMIFIGLLLTLISNFLYSRFNSFVSSSIPTLLILISLIILISKCPFYLNGFFLAAIFLLNAIFGLFFILVVVAFLFVKLLSKDREIKEFLIKNIVITFSITVILLLSYIMHIIFVQKISFFELILAYFVQLGYPEANVSKNIFTLDYQLVLVQFRYFIRDYIPKNYVTSIFLDIEGRILSYFFIFAFISLFIPTKKYFTKKYKDVINFGKFSLLVVLGFYIAEVALEGSSNLFAQSLPWFKWRAVEALSGPIIILACLTIDKVITKAKTLTQYLRRNSNWYKKHLEQNSLLGLFKVENAIITLILISCLSTLISNQRIYYSYYFEQEHVEAIFYIKENIPDDSKILVSDFDDTTNSFYNLLSTYKYYIWDFEFSDNNFNETIDYIIDKNIEYLMIELTSINSTEKSHFKNHIYFDKLYENELYLILEVKFET